MQYLLSNISNLLRDVQARRLRPNDTDTLPHKVCIRPVIVRVHLMAGKGVHAGDAGQSGLAVVPIAHNQGVRLKMLGYRMAIAFLQDIWS